MAQAGDVAHGQGHANGARTPASRPVWAIVAAATAALIIVGLLVLAVPPLLVPDSLLPSPADTLKLRNDVRGSLLTGLTGIGVLVGLYFTWRQLGVATRSAELAASSSDRQRRLSLQRETNERLASAVEQLGHDNPSVQIAGIAILELLAREQPDRRDLIAQVLVALIRDLVPRDPETWPAHGRALASRCPQAEWALVALGRTVLTEQRWSKRYRLNMLDLTGANLEGLELIGADLAHTCLDEAYLRDTDLRNAWMVGARCRRADFGGATVTGARVAGTDFTDAKHLPDDVESLTVHDAETTWPTVSHEN